MKRYREKKTDEINLCVLAFFPNLNTNVYNEGSNHNMIQGQPVTKLCGSVSGDPENRLRVSFPLRVLGSADVVWVFLRAGYHPLFPELIQFDSSEPGSVRFTILLIH